MRHVVVHSDMTDKAQVKAFCAEHDAQVVISEVVEPGTVLIFDDELFKITSKDQR